MCRQEVVMGVCGRVMSEFDVWVDVCGRIVIACIE